VIALSAAGRLGAAFGRSTAFRGATARFDFLRLRPGLAAAGVGFSGAAAAAALAFRTAARPFRCAAAMRRRAAGRAMRLDVATAATAADGMCAGSLVHAVPDALQRTEADFPVVIPARRGCTLPRTRMGGVSDLATKRQADGRTLARS
jgi:hypothetical protein